MKTPKNVFISLVEVKKENWSFGNGVAQYAGWKISCRYNQNRHNFCALLIRSRAASFDYPGENGRLNVLYAWPERGGDKTSSEGVYRNVVLAGKRRRF